MLHWLGPVAANVAAGVMVYTLARDCTRLEEPIVVTNAKLIGPTTSSLERGRLPCREIETATRAPAFTPILTSTWDAVEKLTSSIYALEIDLSR